MEKDLFPLFSTLSNTGHFPILITFMVLVTVFCHKLAIPF